MITLGKAREFAGQLGDSFYVPPRLCDLCLRAVQKGVWVNPDRHKQLLFCDDCACELMTKLAAFRLGVGVS